MQGEPALRCRSPLAASTNNGSARRLPWPLRIMGRLWTSQLDNWLAEAGAFPRNISDGPAESELPQRMEFLMNQLASTGNTPPPAVVAVFPLSVQFNSV